MYLVASSLLRASPVSIPQKAEGLYHPSDPEVQVLADKLLDRLQNADPGTIIPLQFNDYLRASVHARILASALKKRADGAFPDRFIVVEDPLDENDYDAEAALQKESKDGPYKLVCVYKGADDQPKLIGEIDPQVQATYMFVLQCWRRDGGATARALAEADNIRIQTASNRMRRAAAQGIIFKAEEETIEGGGTQHVFLPIQ